MNRASSKGGQRCPLQCIENFGIHLGTPRHLLHATVLYIFVLGVLWCVPSYFYHRISETGQAVVLTLVDSAAAELQSLAEPKITSSEPQVKASLKNVSSMLPKSSSSLLSSTMTMAAASSTIDPKVEQESAEPTIVHANQASVLGNPAEAVNVENTSSEALEEKKNDEVPEVVVVRAEQTTGLPGARTGVDEEARFQVEEETGEDTEEELPKVNDILTTAPELNDSAARAQLIGDEANGVIFDSLVTVGPTEPHEDIPSFSEWTQKRLEEAEKKKTHPNVSVQNPGGPVRGAGNIKIRSKNYASPDCGAKIVAANPEARSARSILVTTRDEYMLNTCTSRVWFIVELCEAIQAKKIELANFELFSSSPRDFSVYVSDRLPTRDWSSVGQFTARDEKDIQSFNLHPQLFGKFIKVEIHSHYGSEHFCPISLFRTYGTSEFEVLETETENRDAHSETREDEDENFYDYEYGDNGPKNLFGSAREAVISIVKKATEALVPSRNSDNGSVTKIQENLRNGAIDSYTSDCITLRYSIICKNCTDDLFSKVFKLLSCQEEYLESLLKIPLIRDTLRIAEFCANHNNSGNNFLTSFFPNEYIIAFCNVLAIKDHKVVLTENHKIKNISTLDPVSAKEEFDEDAVSSVLLTQTTTTCHLDSSTPMPSFSSDPYVADTAKHTEAKLTMSTSTTTTEASFTLDNLATQIKPAKTLNTEEMKKESTEIPVLEQNKEIREETVRQEVLLTVSPVSTVTTSPPPKIIEELSPQASATVSSTTSPYSSAIQIESPESITEETNSMALSETSKGKSVEINKLEIGDADAKQNKLLFGEPDVKIFTQDQIALDSILSDLKELESDSIVISNGQGSSASSSTQPTASTTPQQKESVFLRLSNRIKALERNMSLSSQYLEELSRRYKKQVEEMQRSLERAITTMGEESRRAEEREAKNLEEIAALKNEMHFLSKSVESLAYDRNSWRATFSTLGQYIVLIFIDVIIILLIFYYCRRAEEMEEDELEGNVATTQIHRVPSTQQKNVEIVGNRHLTVKKPKNRRPSEVTANIAGTYQDLMIDDRLVTEGSVRIIQKKKKRKRDTTLKDALTEENKHELVRQKSVNIIPGSITLPSRRASSNESPQNPTTENHIRKRPESAPSSCFVEPFDSKKLIPSTPEEENGRIADVPNESDSSTRTSDLTSSYEGDVRSNASKNSSILKSPRFSSPPFMRTALKSRSERMSCRLDSGESANHIIKLNLKDTGSNTSLGLPKSDSVNGKTGNYYYADGSDESRSSSVSPISLKKEKKSIGLKKMVRKFF